jgi:hypothetical protein
VRSRGACQPNRNLTSCPSPTAVPSLTNSVASIGADLARHPLHHDQMPVKSALMPSARSSWPRNTDTISLP